LTSVARSSSRIRERERLPHLLLFPFFRREIPFQGRRVTLAALADENATVGTLDNGGNDGSHEGLSIAHGICEESGQFTGAARENGRGVLRSSSRTTKTQRLRMAQRLRHSSTA